MIYELAVVFAIEIAIILLLYRFLLRDWVIDKWEQKLDEEGWLVIRLEPVIDEIEDRLHDKLQHFQDSFFGSVGAMTKKAQNLDPMNNIRKAAKSGDWTSMMVEYMANKANLGGLLANNSQNTDENQGVTSNITPLKPQKLKDLLNK